MIHNLQVLRAVVAYMVFLHHVRIDLRPAVGDGHLIELGAAGVDIKRGRRVSHVAGG